MKFRNGFVSNSSSSSFILKKFPENFTVADICEFYGMGEGYVKNPKELRRFAEEILEEAKRSTSDEDDDIYDVKFLSRGKDILLAGYGYQFDEEYGLPIIEEIFKNPEDYFEFTVDDDYLAGPGCACRGDYITRNGLEINMH